MLGFIFSLLVGALAGYIAGRIMGSETSTLRKDRKSTRLNSSHRN